MTAVGSEASSKPPHGAHAKCSGVWPMDVAAFTDASPDSSTSATTFPQEGAQLLYRLHQDGGQVDGQRGAGDKGQGLEDEGAGDFVAQARQEQGQHRRQLGLPPVAHVGQHQAHGRDGAPLDFLVNVVGLQAGEDGGVQLQHLGLQVHPHPPASAQTCRRSPAAA